MYYLQSRYYDPTTGRFINGDDIGILSEEPENLIMYNFFAYFWNNPASMVDDGFWPSIVINRSGNYISIKIEIPWADIIDCISFSGIIISVKGFIKGTILSIIGLAGAPVSTAATIAGIATSLVCCSLGVVTTVVGMNLGRKHNGDSVVLHYSFRYKIKTRKLFKYIYYTKWKKIGYWITEQYPEVYDFKYSIKV